MVDFLQPFYEATVMLSKHNYPSLYHVVPILDVLAEHLLNREEDGPMKKCATAMIEKLNEYSEILNSDLAQLAVLLDPRLNNNNFIIIIIKSRIYKEQHSTIKQLINTL